MKFDKPKGQRIHKQFYGIRSTNSMWWVQSHNRWVQELPDTGFDIASTIKRCKSLRAFKRHLRKHPEIRGKAVLVSRWVGYNIYA
jgi:hypothetical protein